MALFRVPLRECTLKGPSLDGLLSALPLAHAPRGRRRGVQERGEALRKVRALKHRLHRSFRVQCDGLGGLQSALGQAVHHTCAEAFAQMAAEDELVQRDSRVVRDG